MWISHKEAPLVNHKRRRRSLYSHTIPEKATAKEKSHVLPARRTGQAPNDRAVGMLSK